MTRQPANRRTNRASRPKPVPAPERVWPAGSIPYYLDGVRVTRAEYVRVTAERRKAEVHDAWTAAVEAEQQETSDE